MIDFEPHPTIASVRDFVHAFAESQLRPLAREADEKGVLPLETIKQLAQFVGNRASVMPQETTDGPTDSIGSMMAVVGSEELAWGDPAVLLNIPGPGLAAPSIIAAGTPEQKKRFLDDIFNVDSDEPRFGALAVTEPQAGSDVSNVQTTAVRDGDEWILNGSKIYCTNGARAEIVVVNATVDKASGRQGQKFFVIEKGTPGFKIGKIEKKMGLTASETAEFTLEDCRVSMDHLLGGEAALEPKGSGFKGTMKAFDSSRPSVAAMALGIGRAAYEYARDWAAAQLPMSAAFPRRASIEQKLGTMKRELGAARGLIWQAAWMADNKIPNSKEASMSKAYAPQAALNACVGAIQIMGPEGYSKEHLVEKWFRDIKVYDIFEGTGQIQRVIISRSILGRLD
ncbi:MAG TPA: acyl-CoA dehydrogenase family protein [Actinomycetota bacterium]|nr:acyl-CoA dehydrogenase family protein [Actinomycetota bacterium]